MYYVSTRNRSLRVRASEAILHGLAPDGGLFVPESVPVLHKEDLEKLCTLDYAERAAFVMGLFLDDFSEQELLDYARKAYASERFPNGSPAPVAEVGGKYVLELWHGPTCAFKDMALQMLPHLLTASLRKSGSERSTVILTATSGDTGKAALEGFRDVERTRIMVFYPADGVSDIQALQMNTQKGNNVRVQAVVGNFDDTQTGVKKIFSDKGLAEEAAAAGWQFSSANSINWGRLLPQIVYYVSAYCDLINKGAVKAPEEVNFCVPTGNFGNILSAYYALKMGIPVGKLICASNDNNVLTDFIHTGRYDRNRKFFCTISPSMDILISSNLERLLYEVSGQDDALVCDLMNRLATDGEYAVPAAMQSALRDLLWAGYATEAETKAAIAQMWEENRYLADPHTAVALDVAHKYRRETGDARPTVIVSTANPYKFGAAVLDAIGLAPASDAETLAGTDLVDVLHDATGMPVPPQIAALKTAEARFRGSVERDEMPRTVRDFLRS